MRIRLYKALLIDGDCKFVRMAVLMAGDCKSVGMAVLMAGDCKSVGMAVLMAGDYKSPEHKEVGTFLTTDCKSVETPNGRNEQSPPGVQKNSLPPGVPADLQSAVKKRFDL